MSDRIVALAVAVLFVAVGVAVGSPADAQHSGAAPKSQSVGPTSPTSPTLPTSPTSPTLPTSLTSPTSVERRGDWFRPTDVDSKLRWNSTDPWLGYWPTRYAGLTTAFHHFVAGQKLKIASEFALRFDPVPGFGLVVGSYVPNPDTWFMGGLEFFRGWGIPIIDLLDPDVQIGVLFPDFQARIMTDFRQVNALNFVASATGVRIVCCDFFRADLRVVPASVLLLFGSHGSITSVSYGWGLSLDTGVVF